MRRGSMENQMRFWVKLRATWVELCSWESYGPACCFGHGNFPRESHLIYVTNLLCYNRCRPYSCKYLLENFTSAAFQSSQCSVTVMSSIYETLPSLITWIIQTSSIDLYTQKTRCWCVSLAMVLVRCENLTVTLLSNSRLLWLVFVLRSFWRLLFEAVKSADDSPDSQRKLENLHYSALDINQENCCCSVVIAMFVHF